MLDGAIACPACGVLHGRVGDLAYPLAYRWTRTGNEKFLRAAERAVDWTEAAMRREDGGLYNDFQSQWWAITVFAQIALGKTLLRFGDRLPRDLRERWSALFARDTDFVVERFDESFVESTNVNYPASFCEAMALAGRVLGDADKTARARSMADRVMKSFLPDGLFTGEGAPMSHRSPRGLAYVDLGYNLEESLPSLLAYAELCGDGRMKDECTRRPGARDIGIVIGPEGGMTEEEVRRMLDAGARAITLGPRILRAETAAVTAVALAMQLWGDL